MKIFLTAYEIETVKAITYGYYPPMIENSLGKIILKLLNDFAIDETKYCQVNGKAICAIDANEYNKISSCASDKEV